MQQNLYNAAPLDEHSFIGAFFNPPGAITCNNEAGIDYV
jgi:hypothetical protein